jgi:hypothetical protein
MPLVIRIKWLIRARLAPYQGYRLTRVPDLTPVEAAKENARLRGCDKGAASVEAWKATFDSLKAAVKWQLHNLRNTHGLTASFQETIRERLGMATVLSDSDTEG